jgi:hypothetical protein
MAKKKDHQATKHNHQTLFDGKLRETVARLPPPASRLTQAYV